MQYTIFFYCILLGMEYERRELSLTGEDGLVDDARVIVEATREGEVEDDAVQAAKDLQIVEEELQVLQRL
jgi:hypothetical protein